MRQARRIPISREEIEEAISRIGSENPHLSRTQVIRMVATEKKASYRTTLRRLKEGETGDNH